MREEHGLFITKMSVGEIKQRVNEMDVYNKRHAADIKQDKALCKSYCNKTRRLLEDCFMPDMWAIERYKRQLNVFQDSDNFEILKMGKMACDVILANISSMLTTVVPLKDFPSCKEFLDITKDVSAEVAKQAINDRIAKMGLHGILTVDKADGAIDIMDIFRFYNNIVVELNREVTEEHWVLSLLEQALLDKAKAEQGYCFLAMLKTGYNFVKELKGIIDEATAINDIKNKSKLADNGCLTIVGK